MSRRQRGEVLEALEIPLDLQIEILKRLPAKSLGRFKCVSKLWSSLIDSQGHLFPSPPRLYIIQLRYPDYGLLSLASTSDNTAFDLDLKIDEIGGFALVSLRGLILYQCCRERACLYNPTTRQRLTLPAIDFNLNNKQHLINYFLGYDPVLDQYKVVCTVVVVDPGRIDSKHWVFLLEGGSSWKKTEFVHPHIHSTSRLGLCCNGVIYYLANCLIDKRIVVISFDVRSEEFNLIQVPNVVYEYLNSKYVGIIEYGGKPTIFDYTHLWDSSGFVDLWVLEDARKWSRKSLVFQPCHTHFFSNDIYFEVIGTTQNGEVVLRPEYECYPYYILYYDLHKNDVRRIDIRGISNFPTNMTLMNTGESIMQLKI